MQDPGSRVPDGIREEVTAMKVFRNDQEDGTAHERWALSRLTQVNTKIQLSEAKHSE